MFIRTIYKQPWYNILRICTIQFVKYHPSAHRNHGPLACAATADEHDLQRPVVHLGYLMPLGTIRLNRVESIMLIQTSFHVNGRCKYVSLCESIFLCFHLLSKIRRMDVSVVACALQIPSTIHIVTSFFPPRLRFALGQSFTELPLRALASVAALELWGCEEVKVLLLKNWLSVFSCTSNLYVFHKIYHLYMWLYQSIDQLLAKHPWYWSLKDALQFWIVLPLPYSQPAIARPRA